MRIELYVTASSYSPSANSPQRTSSPASSNTAPSPSLEASPLMVIAMPPGTATSPSMSSAFTWTATSLFFSSFDSDATGVDGAGSFATGCESPTAIPITATIPIRTAPATSSFRFPRTVNGSRFMKRIACAMLPSFVRMRSANAPRVGTVPSFS